MLLKRAIAGRSSLSANVLWQYMYLVVIQESNTFPISLSCLSPAVPTKRPGDELVSPAKRVRSEVSAGLCLLLVLLFFFLCGVPLSRVYLCYVLPTYWFLSTFRLWLLGSVSTVCLCTCCFILPPFCLSARLWKVSIFFFLQAEASAAEPVSESRPQDKKT